MEQQPALAQQPLCYFCSELDLEGCISRSLFHKYNQDTSKSAKTINELVQQGKERTVCIRKYQEIKHLVDDQEHMNKLMHKFTAKIELVQLLQYYKYRRFVPIFSKSDKNYHITEDIHIYYYDRLKLHYNEVKRRLNITIDPTQQTQSTNTLITKTEFSQVSKSQILAVFETKNSKQTLKNFQSESKALENLMNFLKKHQASMKKIKTLRTQDCTRQKELNHFKDTLQKKTSLAAYLAEENKLTMKKKSKKVFCRFLQQSGSYREIQSMNKITAIKKTTLDDITRSIYSQTEKVRSKSQNIFKLRKDTSKNKLKISQRNRACNKRTLLTLRQRSERKITPTENNADIQKLYIKTFPKVQMQFNIKPARSQSTNSLKNNNLKENPLQTRTQKINSKDLLNKKQSNFQSQSQTSKLQSREVRPIQDRRNHRTPMKYQIEIDDNDNLASMNKKKLEDLKVKSQRKKESRR